MFTTILKTFILRNYTQHDGLQGDEFSEDAYFRSNKTGEMFFGGINGFNAFSPDSIKDNQSLPEVYITDLQILKKSVHINEKINGRIVLNKPIYLTKEVTITFWDKNIALEFAGLHYSNPKSNKYLDHEKGYNFDISRKGTGTNTEYGDTERDDEPSHVSKQILKRLKPFADLSISQYNEEYQKNAYYGLEPDKNKGEDNDMAAKKKARKKKEASDASSSDASV